jgi:hypothetical protein
MPSPHWRALPAYLAALLLGILFSCALLTAQPTSLAAPPPSTPATSPRYPDTPTPRNSPAPATATARDPFGIRQLFPTRTTGREWFAAWNNHHPRAFKDALDPDDPFFDTAHGSGRYTIDGQGTLRADGNTVRMYVHDPKLQTEWAEDLEITVYITRISESKTLSYSGLQIFARTNHGTLGSETKNLCDDRGYGAKVTLDGRWEFEKETAHEKPHGYVSVATTQPTRELPKATPIGVKFILRNRTKDGTVQVELYRDLTAGKDGGTWEKMTAFTDTGKNWGQNADAPAPNVKPETLLTHAAALPDSESKKPQLTVYFRHEYASMDYQKASIREIDPLP